MTQLAHRVMRFYGNVQYALESIALKQITFLHRDKLNDPFDLYFHFETDFNEDYQAIINHIRQHHAGNLQDFKQLLPKENWQSFLQKLEEDYLNNLRNNSFIFSTCAVNEGNHPKDNLYMWSHYGDGHRGVAIEFDTALLARAVLERQKSFGGAKLDETAIWIDIDYQDELPVITCEHIFQYIMTNDETKLEKIIMQRFFSKSMGWEIEREWRLMWRNDETRLKFLKLDLTDDTINAVYLGCRIADNIKDDFIFETKRHFPKAEIFKARKAKGKFALDFERIALSANANLTEN